MSKVKMVSISIELATLIAEDLAAELAATATPRGVLRNKHLDELQKAIHLGKRPRFDIYGYRWNQPSTGNTYNTVKIFKDDEELVKLSSQYGYGSHYETRATEWLIANGHLPAKEGAPAWQYREEHDIHFNVTDVRREKDL